MNVYECNGKNIFMERVPFHDREMKISIQYHVMLIRQSKRPDFNAVLYKSYYCAVCVEHIL